MHILKKLSMLFIVTLAILAWISVPAESLELNKIEKIRITQDDIPDGFVYGKIPDFARPVLLENPWMMNKSAIKRLARIIYPNGDYNSIKNMYMSILAKKEKPYNDDIVCYIIEYKDAVSGKKEMDKLGEFSKVNSDRTIVMQKGNMAVFLMVDDIKNYHYISVIKERIEVKLENK